MDDEKLPERVDRDPGLVGHEVPQADLSLTSSVKHEGSEIRLGPVVKPIVAIIVVTIISHVAVWLLYVYWAGREEKADMADSPVLTEPIEHASPRLQIDEEAARQLHLREEAERATGYEWVDPNAGVARIPVDRAVEIIGTNGRLPSGPAWSLRPGEQMIGGVIMTPEQVQYANTPPSEAPADQAPAPPVAQPAAAGGQGTQ